jgi:predicted anti-sigma-YlaC factor YlaD
VDDLGPPREGLLAGEFSATADEVTCQQFVELITDYFEGGLPTRTLSHVEEHLVLCDWCVTYRDQMEATITSLGALTETRAPEPSEALLSALRANKNGAR